MATLNYHPAAELFPMMGPDELKELADDIEKNGQRCPIELYDGQILDGRNRYEACRLADVEPDTIKVDSFSIGNDPWAYVISLNLQRRHLTQSQKAMIGQQYLEHCKEAAKGRQASTLKKGAESPVKETFPERGQARDRAGEAVGVSGKLIDAADKVATKGAKELVDAVKAGTVPVTTAAKLAEAPKAEQRKAVKEGPKAVKEAAKRIESSGGAKGSSAGANPVSKKITGGTAFNPEELESEPPPEKDEWGADVQPHATEAFKACPKFDELLKLLRECQRLYLHLPESDGGKFLQSASITSRSGWRHAGIVNAIRDLEDCKPAHTLCPYSVNENQKHGKDCPLCHGLNWTPKIPKGRVPERLITKAKKTLNV